MIIWTKMAESIYGEDFTIHFTNGGAAALFESLILIGNDLPEEKTLRELIDYLQYSLDNFGYGCRFFDIENLPDDLNFKHLAEYARLINLFCIDLTKADTKLEVNISWDFRSRMDWLTRLMNLYLLIEKQLAKNGVEIPPQNVPLSPDEAVTVERQRLLAVYEKKKNRLEKAERVKLLEKIVELKERETPSTDISILEPFYWEYIELMDDTFPKEKQLAVWQRFLEIQTQVGDEEMIRLTKEMLEGVEKL